MWNWFKFLSCITIPQDIIPVTTFRIIHLEDGYDQLIAKAHNGLISLGYHCYLIKVLNDGTLYHVSEIFFLHLSFVLPILSLSFTVAFN